MTPCDLCRGACCESIVLTPPPTDAGRWLGYHGTPLPTGEIELATPCAHLCCGRCAIHDFRPDYCRTYEVGSAACRATVLRRRPDQAAEILALMPAT
jgi:Fe-S-cluster containining protein